MDTFDAWDLKILRQIEFNYKLPHSEIAKRIKRSKAFVTYRIKRMEDSGLIIYRPLIDYSRLGYTYYRVIIETLLSKEEIMDIVKKTIKVVWLVEKYDRENFVFVLAARSFGEFQEKWESLYEKIAPNVLTKDISLAYRVYHLPLSFLHKGGRETWFNTGAGERIDLSDNEKRALDMIHEEPRITNNKLAEGLGISINTLKSLIKGLVHKKVLLAYQTLVNKDALGLLHYKLFLSYAFSKKDKARVIEFLRSQQNIMYITESSYHYDLECELLTKSSAEFEKIFTALKSGFPFHRIVVSQMKSEEKLF